MIRITTEFYFTNTSPDKVAQIVNLVVSKLVELSASSGKILLITDNVNRASEVGNRDWQSFRELVLFVSESSEELIKAQGISRTITITPGEIPNTLQHLANTEGFCLCHR